jgi:hypothetical protein
VSIACILKFDVDANTDIDVFIALTPILVLLLKQCLKRELSCLLSIRPYQT